MGGAPEKKIGGEVDVVEQCTERWFPIDLSLTMSVAPLSAASGLLLGDFTVCGLGVFEGASSVVLVISCAG